VQRAAQNTPIRMSDHDDYYHHDNDHHHHHDDDDGMRDI
jgi:hypothetical protein